MFRLGLVQNMIEGEPRRPFKDHNGLYVKKIDYRIRFDYNTNYHLPASSLRLTSAFIVLLGVAVYHIDCQEGLVYSLLHTVSYKGESPVNALPSEIH